MITPAHLIEKTLYKEICQLKISCHESVTETTKLKWEKWKSGIVNKVETLRSLTPKQKPINSVDVSILGYCVVTYAVM